MQAIYLQDVLAVVSVRIQRPRDRRPMAAAEERRLYVPIEQVEVALVCFRVWGRELGALSYMHKAGPMAVLLGG